MLALIAVALILLVVLGGLPSHTEAIAVFNNAGHAPIFAIIAWITLQLIARRRTEPSWRHYVIAFFVATLLGVLVEVVQSFIGRDAEAGDVLMDASGAAFALCVSKVWQDRATHGSARSTHVLALSAVALLAASIVLAPLLRTAMAYRERDTAFPELARFDRPLGLYFFKVHDLTLDPLPMPARWAKSQGERAVRVLVTAPDLPGVMLTEPARDWRGYGKLTFDVVNPEASPLQLILRIHDRWHDQRSSDRFNRAYVIEARTRGTIEIPLPEIEGAPRGRKLDLANVAGVGLFQPTRDATPGEVFYLAHLRLE